MDKFLKHLNTLLFAALAVACLGEFILCFARGYEELWYTILVPSAVIAALAALAWRTRFKWLYFIATAVMLGGAVLLIGFPNYVMFVALILGGLSLVGEAFWLGVYIKSRLSAGASARLKK